MRVTNTLAYYGVELITTVKFYTIQATMDFHVGIIGYWLLTGACTIKLFTVVVLDFRNKLECLSLASLSSLVQCLQVKREPSRVKHLSGAQL